MIQRQICEININTYAATTTTLLLIYNNQHVCSNNTVESHVYTCIYTHTLQISSKVSNRKLTITHA